MVAVRVGAQMGGERREARGHRPDVQVVDLAHPRDAAHRVADFLHVDSARGRLEQHVERITDQPPRPQHDQASDQEARHGVRLLRAAGHDHEPGHERAERAKRVRGRVTQHALEVQVLAVAAGEDHRRDRVADQAERADRRDPGSVHIGSVRQAADRLDEHPSGHGEEEDAVRERREYLGAPKPERAPAAGGAGRSPCGCDAERHGPDVREDVTGVGAQRDRVEQKPAGDRGREHREVDGQRDGHPAGVLGACVGVSVMGVHAISLAHCLR